MLSLNCPTKNDVLEKKKLVTQLHNLYILLRPSNWRQVCYSTLYQLRASPTFLTLFFSSNFCQFNCLRKQTWRWPSTRFLSWTNIFMEKKKSLNVLCITSHGATEYNLIFALLSNKEIRCVANWGNNGVSTSTGVKYACMLISFLCWIEIFSSSFNTGLWNKLLQKSVFCSTPRMTLFSFALRK